MSKKTDDIETKIKDALDSIRFYINMDGGDIEFIKYEDHVVYIKLTGACQACMYSDDTIKNGIYETLKAEIPEIENVINVDI